MQRPGQFLNSNETISPKEAPLRTPVLSSEWWAGSRKVIPDELLEIENGREMTPLPTA